jgi:DNA-binding Lrp family transcriptional regulator
MNDLGRQFINRYQGGFPIEEQPYARVAAELEQVAAIVSDFVEVNHNYEREHRYNLWFVVVAADEERLQEVLSQIEASSGYTVLDLPLLNEYFIDLGFDLKWT